MDITLNGSASDLTEVCCFVHEISETLMWGYFVGELGALSATLRCGSFFDRSHHLLEDLIEDC